MPQPFGGKDSGFQHLTDVREDYYCQQNSSDACQVTAEWPPLPDDDRAHLRSLNGGSLDHKWHAPKVDGGGASLRVSKKSATFITGGEIG